MTQPNEVAAVVVSGLRHAYGQRVALDGVSLSVAAGEIFGLLGPNGSGKTTLFRILATLLPPQEGGARVLGYELPAGCDAVRRRIGVVFQSPSLDKQLSPEENLRHHGHLYGLRGRELGQRIDALLARFGLSDRRRDRVEGFSGGMRRRVELAKGLLNRPRLLLMDEPSTGLDPSARLEMWSCLEQIRRDDGVTVLLTTHLLEEAERCDRLAILDAGRLVAMDSPQALKSRIGGEVITIISQSPEPLQRRLREQFGIEAEQVDGVLRFERPGAHQFIPKLVEALPGLVQSISVGQPTLEDVFINATGHRFDLGPAGA